jgi:beta-fructofuranosidase
MFGWLPEARSPQACNEAGWSGALSLPLVLDLRHDDTVAVNPAQELQALRAAHWQIDELQLIGQSEYTVQDTAGKALEIQAEFTPHDGSEFGLKVLCSPAAEEVTSIVYHHDKEQIVVERKNASLDPRAGVDPAAMPVHLKSGEPLQLRIFVDHSIIELFVNNRLCLVARVYPTRADSQGVRFFSRQGHTEISNINIWKMQTIWPA